MFGVMTDYASNNRFQMNAFHRSVPSCLRDFDIRKVTQGLWRNLYIMDVGSRASMRFRVAGTAIEDGLGSPLKGQELSSILWNGDNNVLVQGFRNCIDGYRARYFFHIGPLAGAEHLVLQASAQLLRPEPASDTSNIIGLMFINYPSAVTGRNRTYYESDLTTKSALHLTVGSN